MEESMSALSGIAVFLHAWNNNNNVSINNVIILFIDGTRFCPMDFCSIRGGRYIHKP